MRLLPRLVFATVAGMVAYALVMLGLAMRHDEQQMARQFPDMVGGGMGDYLAWVVWAFAVLIGWWGLAMLFNMDFMGDSMGDPDDD